MTKFHIDMPSYTSKLARGMDPKIPQQVTLRLNPPQIEIVNRLYATGLYGNTPAKVVERIFCEGLAKHVAEVKAAP